MKIQLNALYPFDLDVTLCCGQVFRWNRRGDWWYGVVGKRVLKICQTGTGLEFAGANEEFVRNYFGLKDDLHEIREMIGRDDNIKAALREFWGLRIIRQEPWECLISYICATYKSVAAIRQMLLRLSERFGEKMTFDGYDFYTFPTPEKLANATESGLAACGLGYRAKYVLETSKKIYTGDFDLESLRKMPYNQAKKVLCGLSGVGLKVADCVLLFALGKLDAFPVDVWVKRALLKHYPEHFSEAFTKKLLSHESLSNSEYEKLNEFGRNHFGKYAGYAQEYLYHYERTQR